MDLGLSDRVALVTGASSGIGEAVATALAAEGCRVVGTDITAEGIERFASQDPDRFDAIVADLVTEGGPGAAVTHTVERFGQIDILVCAGGIFGDARGGVFAAEAGEPASVISPSEWDRTLAINLRGSFLAAQAAIPHMSARGWGRIILIGSVSGQMGGFGAGADYAASKAALGGMARSMAVTAGPSGVTVNYVNPGMIETPMLAGNHSSAATAAIARQAPMRRLGKRGELAAMIVMLASDHAGYITGAHLDVSQGSNPR